MYCNTGAHTHTRKILTYQLLLLNEFDVGEHLGRQFNGLIEPVLSSVRNVH